MKELLITITYYHNEPHPPEQNPFGFCSIFIHRKEADPWGNGY